MVANWGATKAMWSRTTCGVMTSEATGDEGNNKTAYASALTIPVRVTLPSASTLIISPHSPPSPALTLPICALPNSTSIMLIPALPFPSPIFCAAALRLCICSLVVADSLIELEDSVAGGGKAKVIEVLVDRTGAAETPGRGDVGVVPAGLGGATVLEIEELAPCRWRGL